MNKDYLNSSEIEKQESLDVSVLKSLQQNNYKIYEGRPAANFLDLMKWTQENFKYHLGDRLNLNRFVHNRIIIDGQFLQFCKQNKVSVTQLYNDSVISWKTDSGFEKFFFQGVFLIKGKDFEFLHAALFHKGNQNEDEVGFFVIVSNSNYEAYIKFRNEFDDWVQERDRGNLHIRVINGEDIPYTKDHTWDNVFLPKDIKSEIKGLVENFLASKDLYLSNKIPWKRGILLFGEPGCHAKGTPILMYSGEWKNVEDIVVGDLLMGPDSQPREVLKLVRGNEKMYEVIPNKGKSFIVNENHILHLNYSTKGKGCPPTVNLTIKDYLNLNKPLKQKLKLVKPNAIHYQNNDIYELDPYILGVWLGDGTTGKPEITSADEEIIKYIDEYAILNNLNVRKTKNTNSKAYTIALSAKEGVKNHLTLSLRKLGIFDKKDIPQKYLTAPVDVRMELLAGIIDTDGSYNNFTWRASEKYNKKGYKGCFDLLQKDEIISNKVGNLCNSLGLGFTIKKCVKTIKSTGFSGEYYRMSIYGDISKVPTKLPRKQALVGTPNKSPNNIGIKSINFVNNGDYYGFTVDKDHLYIMDNYWISHNCGKTSLIKTIISMYNFKPVTINPERPEEAVTEAFFYAEEQSPALLFFEDLDSLLERIDISMFLNLMDGISAKNGLLIIATANEVKKLKANVTDRPSRFDRKYKIPLPDQEMALAYLKKWFGNLITEVKCKELSIVASKNKFSYAHLKDLYISVMYEAVANNRKKPSNADIKVALDRLVKEKNILGSNTVSTDKYFK